MNTDILSVVVIGVFLSAMSALGIWLRLSEGRRPRARRRAGRGRKTP